MRIWIIINKINPFSTKFHLFRNQAVGFYKQNAWKTPVKERQFK